MNDRGYLADFSIASGRLLRRVPTGCTPEYLAIDAIDSNSLWSSCAPSSILEVDAQSGRIERRVRDLAGKPSDLIGAGGDLWVSNSRADNETEFSGTSGAMVRVVR
jgi:hypothetical protein